ncbi:imidazole glycerol phosphate synthase subunit HisH [Clostridium cylindrosporum]|uniref:Imidazole glycerol phosphate synthase subunit HisH n=1 Tax=Clostridium cylindrosporum DSM 605 TaxID=1121307 RepID=A0A0J8D983_CLOCY|nr:imidazole glycerol phosphate synthase subunit HisH [Clostridium cylindrosporum]KMT22590.1 imidazole glycerol phosphate synthase subunit HisH [Clostridium cylindrosporum DSM 605]
MIAIIDYGVGNLKSIYNSLKRVGIDSVVTSDENVINSAEKIILPGVGAFNDAMECLKKSGLIDCVKENIASGKPTLGICLGMQLLYEKSYEDGEFEGLGVLKGEVVKIKEGVKIPHMGWNSLKKGIDHKIAEGINEGEYVYYVHSYYVEPDTMDEVVFYSDYNVCVPGVVAKGNIIGMQFHPEKSGDTGLKLLKNFGGM